mgnify:CR=1 FL=1
MGIKLVALILAAGFSSRMGQFKPLLPLGETFVLECAVSLFRKAGVNEILVVTGYRSFDLDPALRELGVRGIKNNHFQEGMFSSIQAAAQTLDDTVDAFFILPVDIPLVRPSTVMALIETFQQRGSEVVYPCFLAERGHPPLISGHLVGDILRWSGNGGLKALLAMREERAVEVSVPDENILLDMDQDNDYRIMKEKAKSLDIPSEMECQALMIMFNAEQDILQHSQVVADVAVKLGKALSNTRCRQNLDLLKAAGLLHDIAKGQPHHAERGAEMIRNWGFSAVADVVGVHMDITLDAGQAIREREILYLADKLVRGSRLVSISERFRTAQERYAGDPEISGNVARRLNDALVIQERIESIIGCPMAVFLEQEDYRRTHAVS